MARAVDDVLAAATELGALVPGEFPAPRALEPVTRHEADGAVAETSDVGVGVAVVVPRVGERLPVKHEPGHEQVVGEVGVVFFQEGKKFALGVGGDVGGGLERIADGPVPPGGGVGEGPDAVAKREDPGEVGLQVRAAVRGEHRVPARDEGRGGPAREEGRGDRPDFLGQHGQNGAQHAHQGPENLGKHGLSCDPTG